MKNRDRLAGALPKGTPYVLVDCSGPYRRGVDDPEDVTEGTEVYPLSLVNLNRAGGQGRVRIPPGFMDPS